MDERPETDRFLARMLATVAVVAAVGLAFLAVRDAAIVFALAFAAVLVATFLLAISDWLGAKTGLPAGVALAVTILAIAAGLGLFGWFLAPKLMEQAGEIEREVPKSLERIRDWVREKPWGKTLLEQTPRPQDVASGARRSGPIIARYVSGAMEFGTHLFLVLLTGIFLAAQPGLYERGAVALVPIRLRPRAREVLDEAGRALRGWLVCQFISMALLGGGVTIGLLALRVPLALPLGALTFLLAFIPTIGVVLAMIPAALVALLQGPWQALWVIGLYVGVSTAENNLVMPLVISRTIHLPPALVLLSQFFLGVLGGPLGLLLATPLLAVVVTLVQEIYVRDILGDPTAGRGEEGGGSDPGERPELASP
jgi:predicted PurR-regulated permease PerM